MIRSFKDKETKKIADRSSSKRLPGEIQRIALRKLRMLDNALSLQDLKSPPGNRLEQLKGDRSGQYSIRINDQWRICFVWRNADAFDVEITDYH